MERYAPQFMELAPRDQVARAIQTEINEGRGFPGGCVHLDLRHLGEEKISARLPQIREIAGYFGGVDPVDDPIPIRPTVHYMMGGVFADVEGRTETDGVFAAGECACVSVHGANRLGGNSLLETVVFGRRAGRNAATVIARAGAPSTAAAHDEQTRIAALMDRSDGETPAAIRVDMESAMREHFGLFKDEAGMTHGLEDVQRVRERCKNVRVRDRGRVFNHDLVHVLELQNMLDVAWMSAQASLWRRESRGGHYRTDYPKLNNAEFLRHSILRCTADGGMDLTTCDVTIEDVQPEAEVKY